MLCYCNIQFDIHPTKIIPNFLGETELLTEVFFSKSNIHGAISKPEHFFSCQMDEFGNAVKSNFKTTCVETHKENVS